MEDLRNFADNNQDDIISVGALTDIIKKKLEYDPNLSEIRVRGEISNFTDHASGHLYFTLKDEQSQISCAMFRQSAKTLNFKPEHGMKVIINASISVYKPRGNYQLIATTMKPDGVGELHKQFLKLKEKLSKEGLFDDIHKKILPEFAKTIGIITSQTGAAIKDLVRNLTRRYPIINIKIIPTLVQGVGSAEDIIKSIQILNDIKDIDIIILGRGGGSLEDLWSFNEEIVARAIYESKIPIISAVGHETDFTIADFVADVRAPTPSTAAEIAVPDKIELLANIQGAKESIILRTEEIIDNKKLYLASIMDRPVFSRPLDFLNYYMQTVDDLILRINKAIGNALTLKKKSLAIVLAKLTSLSPKAVLERGYSIATTNGKIIKTISDVKINDLIEILINKGKIKSKVVEVENGK